MKNKFRGIPTSDGIAIGQALLFERESLHVPHYSISAKEVEKEKRRLQQALKETSKQISQILKNASEEGKGLFVDIFQTHLLIVEDKTLISKIESCIEQDRVNAEYALAHVMAEISERFKNFKDALLRDRISDFQDINKRILHNLLGYDRPNFHELVEEEVIIVAHDLSPSDTAQMRKEKIVGFATDIGGPTSHTAIMARSLEIPAVVGLQEITSHVKDGDRLLVDGIEGVVLLNPSPSELKKYQGKIAEMKLRLADLAHLRDLKAETLDGFEVNLAANIELPEEAEAALRYGAEGIGLFRTEFLFLNEETLPDEDQQYEAYRSVAQAMAPNQVVIRTLDVGGDKFISSPAFPSDMGDNLGCRAIRFSLSQPDIFRDQLKAVLRASVFGNIKIMYPMITSLEEISQANKILEECKDDLRNNNVDFNDDIEVGVMIEVPSAALMADYLARKVEFFSIGTNDLIQYTLAVERTNQQMTYLYDPLHPAILRLIHHTVQSAHNVGIPVGLCGEMAGEPSIIPLLLGLGLDSLSMSPISIPMAKKIVRELELQPLRSWVRGLLNLPTGKEVSKHLKKYEKKIARQFAAQTRKH